MTRNRSLHTVLNELCHFCEVPANTQSFAANVGARRRCEVDAGRRGVHEGTRRDLAEARSGDAAADGEGADADEDPVLQGLCGVLLVDRPARVSEGRLLQGGARAVQIPLRPRKHHRRARQQVPREPVRLVPLDLHLLRRGGHAERPAGLGEGVEGAFVRCLFHKKQLITSLQSVLSLIHKRRVLVRLHLGSTHSGVGVVLLLVLAAAAAAHDEEDDHQQRAASDQSVHQHLVISGRGHGRGGGLGGRRRGGSLGGDRGRGHGRSGSRGGRSGRRGRGSGRSRGRGSRRGRDGSRRSLGGRSDGGGLGRRSDGGGLRGGGQGRGLSGRSQRGGSRRRRGRRVRRLQPEGQRRAARGILVGSLKVPVLHRQRQRVRRKGGGHRHGLADHGLGVSERVLAFAVRALERSRPSRNTPTHTQHRRSFQPQ